MYVEACEEVNLGIAQIPVGAIFQIVEEVDVEHVVVNNWYEYGCTIYKLPGTALFHKSLLAIVSEH